MKQERKFIHAVYTENGQSLICSLEERWKKNTDNVFKVCLLLLPINRHNSYNWF